MSLDAGDWPDPDASASSHGLKEIYTVAGSKMQRPVSPSANESSSGGMAALYYAGALSGWQRPLIAFRDIRQQRHGRPKPHILTR
jgi:hypothetical protein